MTKFKEKTITSQNIYKGKILNLRVDEIELPDGRNSKREIVEHSGGVTIIAITDDNEILLVKQYRKPAEDVLLEIPAGKLEPGEAPLSCAKRELVEETGYQTDEIKKLFSFYTSPGYSNEIIHLFIARGLTFIGQDTDSDEFIEVVKIKKQEIMGLINSGKIRDSKTIIGLLRFLRGDI